MAENQKQRVFAHELSRFERAESDLKKIQTRITTFAGRMNTLGPSEVKEVSVRHEYIISLHHRQEMKQEQIKQIKIELEKKREALLLASQERKVIEKLKEKYEEMKEYQLNQREQAMMDEVAAFGLRIVNGDGSQD